MSFHVPPHLFYGIKLWKSWWQADDLVAPHTDGIVDDVLRLWLILLAYEQESRPCCVWWEGQLVLLQSFTKIPFLCASGWAVTCCDLVYYPFSGQYLMAVHIAVGRLGAVRPLHAVVHPSGEPRLVQIHHLPPIFTVPLECPESTNPGTSFSHTSSALRSYSRIPCYGGVATPTCPKFPLG